jgi:NDP-sugar pyrophosphorylase family protein
MNSKIKRAVVLAGGKGTRLRPYTVVLPKPLMPIGEFPILEVVVRQLVRSGFGHITMAVNHQADLIRAFFGDGQKWNVKIDYSQENDPLGTMGPLNLIPDLPEHFLIMNGDVLTDLDFRKFHDEHVGSESIFSISAYERVQKVDYGVLSADQNGRLIGFVEKPSNMYLVSMGIYMASHRIMEFIPRSFYGFDTLMLNLINKREQVAIKHHQGYWLDIGRPDDYMQAIEEFDGLKDKLI